MTTAGNQFPSAGSLDPLQPPKSISDKIAEAKQSRQDGLALRAGKPKVFNRYQFPKCRVHQTSSQSGFNT